MKKVLIILSGVVLVLSSCLKDKPNTDFSGISPIIELTTASTSGTPQAPVSGLAFWSGASVLFPSGAAYDTVTFTANVASDYPLNVPTTVTLAPDSSLVTSFNASGTSTTTFDYMPDSLYTFSVRSGTIPAGGRLDTFTVIFNASKFDPAVSYMLPIQITNVTNNLIISGNLSTIYFHVVGNPLAGAYTVTGTRYNYTGVISWQGPSAGIPNTYVSTANLSAYSPKTATPASSSTVDMDFANLGANGYQYEITGNSDFSSISVDYSFDSDVSNIATYIVSYTAPGPTTKASFHIMTYYNNAANGSGNDRIVDEYFTQQ